MARREEIEKLKRQRDTLAASLSELENRFEGSLKLLAAIHRLTEIPLTALGLHQAAQMVVESIVQELHQIEACSILIYDPGQGRLKLIAAKGPADLLEDQPDEYNKDLSFAVGDGVAGRTFAEGRPYFVDPEADDARFLKQDPQRHSPASMACLPLASQNRRLGVLNISFPTAVPFDPPRRRDLALIGGVAANILQACGAPVGLDFSPAEEPAEAPSEERPTAMGRLSPGLIHDFNNLLASVQGYAELLLVDEDDDVRRDWLGRILIAGQSCSRMIRRLGIILGGGREAPPGPVDLSEVVEEALALTKPRWKDQAQAEGQKIEIDFDRRPVRPVWGSADQLKELVVRLLLNAVEAVGGNGRVAISLAPGDEESVVLKISRHPSPGERDQGEALPPELPLAREVIERHDGELVVEEGEGGAIHILTFPAVQAEPADTPPPEPIRRGLARLRILVVDDEPSVLGVLAGMIERLGHKALRASGAGQGLALLEQSEPDLVFTDLSMPAMSGLEFARLVKKRRPGLPVILVTGWPGESDPAAEAGIDFTMAKPFQLEDVAQAIAAVSKRS